MSTEVYSENQYYCVNTSLGVHPISTSRCLLKRLVINTTAAGLIDILDGSVLTGAATVAQLPSSATVGVYDYDVVLASGLIVRAVANSNLTIVYRLI